MVQEIYSMYCTNKNMLPIWELEGSSVQLQGVTKTDCPGILAFFYTRIQGYLVRVKVLIYPWSVYSRTSYVLDYQTKVTGQSRPLQAGIGYVTLI